MSVFDQFEKKYLPGDKALRKVPLDCEEWQFQERDEILSKPEKSFWGFYVACLVVLAILTFQLLNLQISQGSSNRLLAEGNRMRQREVFAPRGLIYDRKGVSMVNNVGSFSLEIYPLDLSGKAADRQEVYEKLAQITQIPASEIKEKSENKGIVRSDVVVLKDNIDRDAAMLLETRLVNFPGVAVVKKPTREYKNVSGLAQILGYVGKITAEEIKNRPYYKMDQEIGKEGLEKIYEDYLRGKKGIENIEVDSRGRSQRLMESIPPELGNDLNLALDFGLVEEMSKSFSDRFKETGSTAGAAVAIDPKTGGLLGVISLPSYDNNIFTKGISNDDYKKLTQDPDRPMFNRAISGTYPSGSTIKPMIAAAALQEGNITGNTILDTSIGAIKIGSWTFPDWKVHGLTDVRKAIAESNDIFFYAIGGGWDKIKGLGVEKMKAYLEKFGFGEKLGIDLPGEAEGLVPSPAWRKQVKRSAWYLGDTYHMAIGQGDLLATPLQMAVSTAAVANGGEVLRPYLVQNINDKDGNEIFNTEKKVIRSKFIDQENIKIVKEGMRQTVTEGSAKSALGELEAEVEVAAKTGTAQYGNEGKTHSWMVSFAPYNDPKIALAVIVEGGGDGHAAAGQITKDVLGYYFAKP